MVVRKPKSIRKVGPVGKTKNERFRAHEWVEYTGSAGAPIPGGTVYNPAYANGTQNLYISTGHNLSKLGQGDVGGAFHCLRRELSESNFGPVHNRTVSNPNNAGSYNYKGSYYASEVVVSDADFPVPPTADSIELNAAGATAISRVIPTNPLTGLATTLAELKREGIPHLVGADLLRQRALRARNAGSEYLNVEFGWRPLVNDVLSLATSITDSDDLIQKYVRESGKRLHRGYTYPTDVSSSTVTETGKYPQPAIKVGYWTSTGTLTTVTTTTVKRWFKGCFTYHLAPPGSVKRAEQIAAKRFGHRITPEVLWNLAPWTWAADWVGNIGDVLHNVSAFSQDGLVMPYGYMMKETSIRKSVTFSGATMKYGGRKVSCSQTFTTTRKQRAKATPYGFGLNPASFSGRQWAILGALGLARSPGQLNPE